MKRLLTVLMTLIPLLVGAQGLKYDDVRYNWEAKFDIGFNSEGWQFDGGIAWFPVQYFGLKATIGAVGKIGGLIDYALNDYGPDSYQDDEEYPTSLRAILGPVFRSPRLIYLRGEDAGIYLFAEPGIMFNSAGCHKARNARYVNWDFKGGINLQFDRWIVSAGYEVTSFNLYTGMRKKDPDFNHAGYLGVSYKF